jgi:hypothetical protein
MFAAKYLCQGSYSLSLYSNNQDMKKHWFKQSGIIFLPVSFFGWLILSAAIFLSVYEFIVVDAKSHSASDTLMNFFFRLVIIGVVYTIIGALTSRKM